MDIKQWPQEVNGNMCLCRILRYLVSSKKLTQGQLTLYMNVKYVCIGMQYSESWSWSWLKNTNWIPQILQSEQVDWSCQQLFRLGRMSAWRLAERNPLNGFSRWVKEGIPPLPQHMLLTDDTMWVSQQRTWTGYPCYTNQCQHKSSLSLLLINMQG